jgi:hypothetical protein
MALFVLRHIKSIKSFFLNLASEPAYSQFDESLFPERPTPLADFI